jgi:hypothetical protein
VSRHRPGVIVALAAVGEPGLEVLLDAGDRARCGVRIDRYAEIGVRKYAPNAADNLVIKRRAGRAWL